MTLFGAAVGFMEVKGEEEGIIAAFLWWFKSRRLPVGDEPDE